MGCLWLFVFRSPNFARATICSYHPLLTLTTLPSPCSYVSERSCRDTEQPDSMTGLLILAYGCFWDDPNTSVPHHQLPTESPHLISAPRLLREGGTVLEARAVSVALATRWELKSPIYFLQTLSPCSIFFFFFGFGGQRKARSWPAILLAICLTLGSTHMSIPTSQFTLLHPSMAAYLFPTSASLFCPASRFIWTIF